uniref:DUF7477 domain-containing protein n=1 Tax=Physcomitrium patens TaxID=3218 RepID=A0A7I4AAR1_PHYPA
MVFVAYITKVDKATTMSWYHYDAVDSRLMEHVEKDNEDGLYISSVASCTNLWALVMDARTRFIAQVHELSHVFAVLECICHSHNPSPGRLIFQSKAASSFIEEQDSTAHVSMNTSFRFACKARRE